MSDEKKIEDSKQVARASLALEVPVEPVANRLEILVLQHPQEPDKILGSAPLVVRALENARLKVGLSWPKLARATGREDPPGEWGVCYLGARGRRYPREVNVVDKKLEPVSPAPQLRGVILIDGTWSQAKALWWRNPWFLKLRRVVIQPVRPSRYGKLRKEPRPEAVSTVEAAALVLRHLEGNEAAAANLEDVFERMLSLATSGRGKRP
ncbi:MAG: DTW domain-containing protein [Bdellovibrionales bacterium]|nr:DTW domain-containing protein [Bdellovibrionales bacterium]